MQALEHGDPRSVGRFRILARVGSGGMAVVYFGRSSGGRPVAVKLMHAEIAGDWEHRQRFRREVAASRAVGGLYSPGVLDAEPDAVRPWLAMEYVPGISLREAVREFGPLPVDAIRSLAAGLAEALALIHRAGYVHLDLKPSNVLLTANRLAVIDFGIAQEVGAHQPTSQAGSRGYMSPEQDTGARPGPASDVFSFGSTLAYAYTGVAPDPSHLPHIADDWLRTLIAHCLHPDPAVRPDPSKLAQWLAVPDAPRSLWPPLVRAELDRRLGELESPPTPGEAQPPIRRRRALLYGIGTAAAGLSVGGLVWAGVASQPPAPSPSPRPTATAVPSPSPTASPTTRTRVLEIYLTGNVTLTSLTYTINGKTTTLSNVKLPWRTAVDIPDYPPATSWQLSYRHKEGEVTDRVFVDRISIGQSGSSGTSGHDAGTA